MNRADRDEMRYAMAVAIFKRTQDIDPSHAHDDDHGFSDLPDEDQHIYIDLATHLFAWLLDQGWTPPT